MKKQNKHVKEYNQSKERKIDWVITIAALFLMSPLSLQLHIPLEQKQQLTTNK